MARSDTPKWLDLCSPITKEDELIPRFEMLRANLLLKLQLGDHLHPALVHYQSEYAQALADGVELPDRFDPERIAEELASEAV